jgi:hypothetical protein
MRGLGVEASPAFSEEKAAKRLLLIWAMGVARARHPNDKSFCAAFFKKRLLAFR